MSKLSLKVLLGVFALMFSASVGLSAECKDDPNECTPKSLCEVATQVINDNKVWSEDASTANHIAFVKELGMECGVVEITDPCDLDPNECKVKQLCEKATTGDEGSKSWNADAEAYVELAKKYGLECDVQEVAANKQSDSFANWSDNAVCWFKKNNNGAVYIEEAKKRGLSCDVGGLVYCSLDNLKNCSTQSLCQRATYVNYGIFAWSANTTFVDEAKKRGLSCGVKEANCGDDNIQICSDTLVCQKATQSYSDGKGWNTSYMAYIDEAIHRGLTCGVGERVRPFKYLVSDQELARHFKRFALSERKRIQYALKELGFYSKAIDGLWGEGTRTAFKNYGKNLVLENDIDEPSEVIFILLNEVDDYPNYGTCAEDISLCSANYVCEHTYKKKYHNEAIRRNLTCAVKTCAEDVSLCSPNYVCKRINNKKYNNEAIRRNLTCAGKKSYSSSSSSSGSSSSSSSTYSKNAGLTAIISNPSMSGEQAMAICKPQAKLAYNNAVNSDDSDRRNRDYGSTTRCTSFTRYSMNCNTTSNSGGPSNAMQGILLGLTVGLKAKRVAEAVLESCLAQYGWKE